MRRCMIVILHIAVNSRNARGAAIGGRIHHRPHPGRRTRRPAAVTSREACANDATEPIHPAMGNGTPRSGDLLQAGRQNPPSSGLTTSSSSPGRKSRISWARPAATLLQVVSEPRKLRETISSLSRDERLPSGGRFPWDVSRLWRPGASSRSAPWHLLAPLIFALPPSLRNTAFYTYNAQRL